MSSLRASAIRVAPLPGEALDSWLETLSARMDTPLGHMRGHLGLGWHPGKREGHGPVPNWTAHLTESETRQLAAVAGLAPASVTAMTLSRWDGHAISIDTATRAVNRRRSFWSRGRGSRYCPACLETTGGRWRLTWRLTWHFACLEHGVLLAERCGGCGGITRRVGHPLNTVPSPGTCGSAQAGDPTKATHRPRCGFHLAASAQPPATQPMLAAQRLIAEAIDNPDASPLATGIYRDRPVRAAQFLGDLRTLSTMIFLIPEPDGLARWATPEVLTRYHAELRRDVAHNGRLRPVAYRQYLVPIDAAAAGLVLTAAVDVLTAPDIPTAADRLRWITEPLRTGQPRVIMADRLARTGVSPPLHAAVMHAGQARMPVARQLKHRITQGSAHPAPHPPADRAARLPVLLWPRIAIPLIPPDDRGARRWRLALPVCIMLIGATTTTSEAVELLGKTHHRRGAVSRIHTKIKDHPAGAAILHALTLVADELDRHGSEIDYTRRRALFAHRTEFITLDQWAALHVRRRGDPARTLVHAQRWLYETLTGNPAEAAALPLAVNDYKIRTCYSRFRMRLLPAEVQLLRDVGTDNLNRLGIDEPLTWQPTLRFPPDLLAALPGRDPDDIDVAAVHRLFLGNYTITAKAIALATGTSSEHIRSTLDDHPVHRIIVPTPSAIGGDRPTTAEPRK